MTWYRSILTHMNPDNNGYWIIRTCDWFLDKKNDNSINFNKVSPIVVYYSTTLGKFLFKRNEIGHFPFFGECIIGFKNDHSSPVPSGHECKEKNTKQDRYISTFKEFNTVRNKK